MLQEELKSAMKGLKRQIAKEKQRGDGRIEVGKEPMKFELYKFLARKFLLCAGEIHKSNAFFS